MSEYSSTERMLHNSAFKTWSTQVSLSNLESKLYKSKLSGIGIEKPVFITALPRAGTTLLLEISVGSGEFASHSYREMPFLHIPIFWRYFSKLFKQSDEMRERAHGDGMMINVDSPEAFEEVFWKGYWPSRYLDDRIKPWAEPDYPEFEKYLQAHIQKLIYLQGGNGATHLRYMSKNNLNIARTKYLKKLFPDSIIIVPFRAPLEHISSLLRQHKNFMKVHGEDSFTSQYMEDIGHYDFGKNLRPVDFNNWVDPGTNPDPNTLWFWLEYWIQGYEYMLKKQHDHIHLLAYDELCADPGNKLEKFGKLLELKNMDKLMASAERIKAPRPYEVDTTGIPQEVLDRANTLYQELLKASAV